LIAAQNRVGAIGATVASVKDRLSEWPGSSVWVVADHCVDETAAEAEGAGAQVAVRSSGRLGTGPVIAWWMQRYEAIWESREAVVILGAESRLEAGSLDAMRRAIANGGDAAQAYLVPEGGADARSLEAWSKVLRQRIDDEARMRCGWSVPLRGTGMAFRCRVLAELAPRLRPSTEDQQLNLLLAARRARVELVPEAIVRDPQRQPQAGASRHCAHWFRQRLEVLISCRGEILTALTGGDLGSWFLLWPQFLRPRVLFIAARVLLLLVFPWLALAGLTMDAIYYLAGAAIVDHPRRYLLDLLAVPRYAGTWLYGLGIAMMRR
jgi:hypothetical protein